MERAHFQHDQIKGSEPRRGSPAYSVVRPVSPLKNTAWRDERITIDDHSVALRSCRPRPEKCCDGAAVTVRSVPGTRCDSHQSSSTMRSRRHAPASRCAPTPSDVTNGTSRLRQFADRRIVEVVVVIVRNDDHVDRRQRRSAIGTGWKRFGPAKRAGEARGPHTGSVSTRSRRSRAARWSGPSHVARRPLPGACAPRIEGIHRRQWRARYAPFAAADEIPLSDGIGVAGSRNPGMIGCRLRNASPAQSGRCLDALETFAVRFPAE